MIRSLVKSFASKAGYSIRCVRNVPVQLLDPANTRGFEFEDAVYRHMHLVGTHLTFLQIGVYDGVTHDPLRRHIVAHSWSGLMVEPQKGSVEGLRELYRDQPRIRIVNAAVDETSGKRVLYTVVGPHAPMWAGGLASFDRDTIVKHEHLCPGLSSMIHEETVTCLPFETILADLPSDRLDILQIDTEGADGLILSLFPFDRIRPAIVHFEIKHLDKTAQEQAYDLLLKHGYRLARSGGEDMLAVL
jgi:FkbM family methyltransferase